MIQQLKIGYLWDTTIKNRIFIIHLFVGIFKRHYRNSISYFDYINDIRLIQLDINLRA